MEMTYERAAEILDPEHREAYDSIEPVITACKMGMEALKKQIPAKVNLWENSQFGNCPYCNEVVYRPALLKQVHCFKCGQALKIGRIKMDESYYTARLVITEGCEDRLDMTITCQNAQQLLRAKDTIADQMNTYIAEFAVQSGLTGAPSNAEQNAAALQAVIQEQTEKAKQQEPEEPAEPEPPEVAPDEPEESPPLAR